MNGAESLIRTLAAGGVEVCFSNLEPLRFILLRPSIRFPRCALCWACSKAL